MSELVPAEAARAVADERRAALAARDPGFVAWGQAATGEPVPVHTLGGVRSYWLVPVERDGRAVGFVRVTLDGRIAAAGWLGRDPARSPHVVTGISAEAAREAVRARVGDEATLGAPLYVHEGPPGREAWRLDVTGPHGVRRVLLVGPGGVHEPRPPEDRELE